MNQPINQPIQNSFKFNLTFQEAQTIVAALRKLPMEVAEPIVKNLETQFDAQVRPAEKQPVDVDGKDIPTPPETPVTEVHSNSNSATYIPKKERKSFKKAATN